MKYRSSPFRGPRLQPYGMLSLHPANSYSLQDVRIIQPDRGAFGADPLALKHREQTVCFTGHRQLALTAELTEQMDTLLEKLYQQGYRSFLCGGALGFDQFCGYRVAAMGSRYADVRLIMVIPCADQCALWSQKEIDRYEQLLYLADQTIVLSSRYATGCMHMRNRFMVDHASFCVSYLHSTYRSGTAATVRYALSQQVDLLNMAVPGEVQRYVSQP